MTYAWIEEIGPKPDKAWGVSWGIDAPWAHPAWSQYILYLYDLTTVLGKPPKLYLEGATHEFLLYAINPDKPLIQDEPLSGQDFQLLQPANYGYQFKAEGDLSATKRLQEIVDLIVAEKLSPDTDHSPSWNMLFSDAHNLKR